MSQRVSRTDIKRRKRNRRLVTLAWIVGVAFVVIFLLATERAEWLYVLSTLGVSALLIVVAFADLHGGRQGVDPASLGDDSAALGANIPATATGTAPSDWRGTKTRRGK